MPGETSLAPSLRLERFEGPLDLLFHLIEKSKVDLYDIPIAEIADQYIEYIAGLSAMDLEIASEFLVMAATLLHIKSRMLLPSRRDAEAPEGEDPRDELVVRLLEYRRCKTLAAELKKRGETWNGCVKRLPETPARLGIDAMAAGGPPVSREAFYAACVAVSERNRARFNDLSGKVVHLLKRDKVSIRDKMRSLWSALVLRTRAWFGELFPADLSRAERVNGFLAVLELLRLGRIEATQDRPFSGIHLEAKSTEEGGHDWFDAPDALHRDIWKEYR